MTGTGTGTRTNNGRKIQVTADYRTMNKGESLTEKNWQKL